MSEKGPSLFPQPEDPKWEPIDEIPTNDLEKDPGVEKTAYGEVAFGTHIGINKIENQDRIVINTATNGLAVIDGMSGHKGGSFAADTLANNLEEAFRSGGDVVAAHEKSNTIIANSHYPDAGACYATIQFEGKTLKATQAGDVDIIIIRNQEHPIKITKDHRGRAPLSGKQYIKRYVGNPDVSTEPDAATPDILDARELEIGDRIIVCTDGLSDNMSPDEIRDAVKNLSAEQSLRKLFQIVITQMKDRDANKTTHGKRDNIGYAIYDIQHLPST